MSHEHELQNVNCVSNRDPIFHCPQHKLAYNQQKIRRLHQEADLNSLLIEFCNRIILISHYTNQHTRNPSIVQHPKYLILIFSMSFTNCLECNKIYNVCIQFNHHLNKLNKIVKKRWSYKFLCLMILFVELWTAVSTVEIRGGN